jgi:hypothetical protein
MSVLQLATVSMILRKFLRLAIFIADDKKLQRTILGQSPVAQSPRHI